MNANVFEGWVKKLGSRITKSNRTGAPVLDNCSAHSNDDDRLAEVKLIFLPPNTAVKI